MPTTTVARVGAGRYSDVFKLSEGRNSVIAKLSYYRDNTLCDFADKLRDGDTAAARAAKNKDSIMVSAAFADVTNKLMAARASPHFVFVFCNADCRHLSERLRPLLADRFKSSSPTQLKYNNVCLMEVMHGDLQTWLSSRSTRGVTDDTVRGCLFGVLYTLAVLQRAYSGFRHNDLSCRNVLVKKTPPTTTGYTFDGASYLVKDMPILVALSDYDFTHVPNHPTLRNERVVGGKYKVTERANATYDAHFFLRCVQTALLWRRKRLPETTAFLDSLGFEAESRVDAREVPGFVPADLLRHAYFAPLAVRAIPPGVDAYGI